MHTTSGGGVAWQSTSDWLSVVAGRPFVIENRPGAGTNIATEAVVRAPADGYTLLMVGTTHAINATLYNKLNFHFITRRYCCRAQRHGGEPIGSGHKTSEFIAYAKANAGKLNMASGGIGSLGHVSGELFKMMAGINIGHGADRGLR